MFIPVFIFIFEPKACIVYMRSVQILGIMLYREKTLEDTEKTTTQDCRGKK